MTVRSILKQKGQDVYTISQSASLEEAAKEMVKNNVGALIVKNEQGRVVGIISERDIIRNMTETGLSLKSTAVDKIMSKKVIICVPSDDLDYVQNVMTEMRIRHVPVFEDKELKGVISIGDVVKARLAIAHYEIRFYEDYIQGKYPG